MAVIRLGALAFAAVAPSAIAEDAAFLAYTDYGYYEDLHADWNSTECRYAIWEGIAHDFYDRFLWDEETFWARAENNTFLSTSDLEAWIFDRSLYDQGVSPNGWLLNDLGAPPQYLWPSFQLTGFEIDERANAFSVSGFLNLAWMDFRLSYAFTPACRDSLGSKRNWVLHPFLHDTIWHGHWYFVNKIREELGESTIHVYPTGWVVESLYVSETLTCDLDLHELPYDAQKCHARIGANGLAADTVRFAEPELHVHDPVSDDRVAANQWIIERARTGVRLQSYFSSDRDMASEMHSEAILTFVFRRKSRFYLTEVVVPAALFLFVAYIGFFISASVAPARVGVTVIPVLIMRTLLNETYSRMQIISYLTRLTKFLVCAQCLSVLCVLEFGVVSYFLRVEYLRLTHRKHLVTCHRVLLREIEDDDGAADDDAFRDDDPREPAVTIPDGADPRSRPAYAADDVAAAMPWHPASCWTGGGAAADDACRRIPGYATAPVDLGTGDLELEAVAAATPQAARRSRSRLSQKHRLLSFHEMRPGRPAANPLVDRLVDRFRSLYGSHSENGRTIDCDELSRALVYYDTYLSPEQSYYTMIHYKHARGEDVAAAPPYGPDDAAVKDLVLSFKEFVDLITGGALEELIVTEITEVSWFYHKPCSQQCDLLCRAFFPPCAILILSLCLFLPS